MLLPETQSMTSKGAPVAARGSTAPKVLGTAGVLILAFAGFAGVTAAAQARPQDDALLSVRMAVSGHDILVNGRPFRIHGLTLVGLAGPKSSLAGAYAEAYQHLGGGELQAARSWRANTIRFLLGQRGLDPQDALYSEVYLHEVHRAVANARNAGFLVIVALHDETRSIDSGDSQLRGMPTMVTARAWDTLTRLFNSDPGVIYELFDGPALKVSPGNWTIWREGGPSDIVGHQALVGRIRATQSENLILADGLDGAESLEGCPLLNDPRQKLAYGVHSYLTPDNRRPDQWERNFGDLAAREAVIATEWSAATDDPNGWCRAYPDQPVRYLPGQLLRFLGEHGIGVVGWAFDLPGTIVTDFHGTPNEYPAIGCGEKGGGPGRLLQYAFFRR